MPVIARSNDFSTARSVLRNDACSATRIRIAIPRAARSACTNCSIAMSPLPTVNSSMRSGAPSRWRMPSAARFHPAALNSASARSVSNGGGAWPDIGRPGGIALPAGVAYPATAAFTNCMRSIERARARRTRTSSNGARVVFSTSTLLKSAGGVTSVSVGSARTRCAIVGETPAISRSPLTSPANFVAASSTTATTICRAAGGPPSVEGNAALRAKRHRRPGVRSTNRNGPLPTGDVEYAACRHAVRGTVSSRCRGTRGSSASTFGTRACGVLKYSCTVESSTMCVESSVLRSAARGEPTAGSRAASNVKRTSAAVVGTASCHVRPSNSRMVSTHCVESHDHSRAKYGSGCKSESNFTRVTNSA